MISFCKFKRPSGQEMRQRLAAYTHVRGDSRIHRTTWWNISKDLRASRTFLFFSTVSQGGCFLICKLNDSGACLSTLFCSDRHAHTGEASSAVNNACFCFIILKTSVEEDIAPEGNWEVKWLVTMLALVQCLQWCVSQGCSSRTAAKTGDSQRWEGSPTSVCWNMGPHQKGHMLHHGHSL